MGQEYTPIQIRRHFLHADILARLYTYLVPVCPDWYFHTSVQQGPCLLLSFRLKLVSRWPSCPKKRLSYRTWNAGAKRASPNAALHGSREAWRLWDLCPAVHWRGCGQGADCQGFWEISFCQIQNWSGCPLPSSLRKFSVHTIAKFRIFIKTFPSHMCSWQGGVVRNWKVCWQSCTLNNVHLYHEMEMLSNEF